MAEMEEVSDVAIDNIRFALMAIAMAVAGIGGMMQGVTTSAVGLMVGVFIQYYATKFHPDTVDIHINKS
ncbi:hypothetical protein SAMN05216388_101342 [Halorientalis persicus]|uniref:Uncharacterized protein n=1 Tax=Halorientalis persicus TaxID=1367881 RepID=A0A1H8Q331_9EURY|nr:hypothetical protein [Halorientalis persicus]SEO48408.1 hypothetical protein SAMN05216388_101342 [Halorientalis persicus]